MTKELDEALARDFPLLYRGSRFPKETVFGYWGFECGDGWEPLLRRLSAKLTAMILFLPKEEREAFQATQVKEKYGTLRYYMSTSTGEMYDTIKGAEDESCYVCERCGATGLIGGEGWVLTLCDPCRRSRQAEISSGPRPTDIEGRQ